MRKGVVSSVRGLVCIPLLGAQVTSLRSDGVHQHAGWNARAYTKNGVGLYRLYVHPNWWVQAPQLIREGEVL